MPQGDGTGPAGQGQGQRNGQCRGRGNSGASCGICICPKCGYSTLHIPGQPCNQKRCPQCAVPLTRG